ncbi:alpha mannosidase-like protein [Entomortierella beljakovae]|nr:alpha mannosidase-like protein [Entomortierella beljakovae]
MDILSDPLSPCPTIPVNIEKSSSFSSCTCETIEEDLHATVHRRSSSSSSSSCSFVEQTQEAEQQNSKEPQIQPQSTSLPTINNLQQNQNNRNRTPAAPATTTTAASTGIANGGGGGLRPWILIVIFSIVQMFLSSTQLSNGVNASSSDQATDPLTGSGNGGTGAGYNYQYFRRLPPITDISKAPGTIVTKPMTESRRLLLREEAKKMFMHGYNGYLNYAFPRDELNPVACIGRGPDKFNPNNININDVLGDFSLTLIDALDTLAAMREPKLFKQAITMVKKYVRNFDINSRVQVFEVNIRVLGALLSAHLYASDPTFKSVVEDYNDELLVMAEDLGKRLMKAFENTPTGIPWPRVNLRRGVLPEESPETCVAGAGSLLLEFGVLSRLTGNKSYEQAARRALFELWDRRSKIGLLGNTINITSGNWMSAMTGIGAGTDSFYEYLLKSYVLLGDKEYWNMYETSQETIRRNLLHDSKYFYKHVHLEDGTLMAHWVDSLSAFMPGVQVLGGDLESAIKNHLYYYNIWRKYQAIPERFDFVQQTVAISNYPLRPEFIESNYFLYRATKDPFYLEVGEMVLRDLQKYTKTKCGWASLMSVVDKRLEDRMESFALSETIKYLYLLFDEENILHQELKDTNFVFTTEGHILKLLPKHLSKEANSFNNSRGQYGSQKDEYHYHYLKQAPSPAIHDNSNSNNPKPHGLVCKPYVAPETFLKNIPYRPDADFARQLVGTREDHRDILVVDPKGYCEKPTLDVERVVVEFSGPPKKTVFEVDTDEGDDDVKVNEDSKTSSGQPKKDLMVIPIQKGVFINRIVGVKMHVQYDGIQNGYRAVRVADYPLSLNCNVYVEKASMQPLWDSYQRAQDAHLRVFNIGSSSSSSEDATVKDIPVTPADFGYWRPKVIDYSKPLTYYHQQQQPQQPQQRSDENQFEDTFDQTWRQPLSPIGAMAIKYITTKNFIRIQGNEAGCRPYTASQSLLIQDKILVVDRGGCLFILKAFYAQSAKANSIVVINNEETTFAMTGAVSNSATNSASSTSGTGVIGDKINEDEIDIHSVMIKRSDGLLLLDWTNESISSDSSTHENPDDDNVQRPQLTGGFIQRKISEDQLATARLSYNSLPIVNIFSVNAPLDVIR